MSAIVPAKTEKPPGVRAFVMERRLTPHPPNPRRMRLGAIVVTVLLALVPAAAMPAVTPAVAAAAQREGSVVWYSALDAPAMNALVQRFNATHPGITAQGLNIGSTRIGPRVMTEESAGKVVADVVSGDQLSISQLAETDVLQPLGVTPPPQLMKGSVDPQGR